MKTIERVAEFVNANAKLQAQAKEFFALLTSKDCNYLHLRRMGEEIRNISEALEEEYDSLMEEEEISYKALEELVEAHHNQWASEEAISVVEALEDIDRTASLYRE